MGKGRRERARRRANTVENVGLPARIDLVDMLKARAKTDGVSLTTYEAMFLLSKGVVMVDSHPMHERFVDAKYRHRITLHPEKVVDAQG